MGHMRPRRHALALTFVLGLVVAVGVRRAALASEGILVTFTSGTGEGPGKLTLTNGGTGSTATVGLAPRLPATACAGILAGAAPKVGLRAEATGVAVKIFNRGAIVRVEGATITKTDL
jgi:hypothetical protein